MRRMKSHKKVLSLFPFVEKIKLFSVLSIRYIANFTLNQVSKIADRELSLYDALKLAVDSELNPKISLDEKFNHIKFQDGYLKNTEVILRREGSDTYVFSQILLREEYLPLIKFILQTESPENIRYIVDAGANIGLTTIYLKHFFSHAKIIAVEPDAENFAAFEKNIALNQIKDVVALKAGLWNKSSLLDFDYSFRDGLEWSIALQEAEQTIDSGGLVQGVMMPSLRKTCSFPRVDILKIDIEGGERFLFADDKSAAETLEGVRFLALEIHDEFNIRHRIEKQLKNNDFAFFYEGETLFAYKNSK